MTSILSLFTSNEIVFPEKVEEIAVLEVHASVRQASFINKEGESDPCLLAEEAGVVNVPKANSRDGSTSIPDLRLMSAQLRDMVAAEDSAIVA